MEIKELQRISVDRAQRLTPIYEWELSQWGVALAGECGEACNVIKKINRIEIGAGRMNRNNPAFDELIDELGAELADTMGYLVLLAAAAGIDLEAAIKEKFNAVSEKHGVPERID